MNISNSMTQVACLSDLFSKVNFTAVTLYNEENLA